MTSKPDSVSTLGYHWTDHTGRPLEPQVHWDATGTTLADANTQWCSSGNPVLICIIGTHWKTTGKPLEDHWKHTGISPVAFQCTLGSKFQAHWIATGRPLAQGKGGDIYIPTNNQPAWALKVRTWSTWNRSGKGGFFWKKMYSVHSSNWNICDDKGIVGIGVLSKKSISFSKTEKTVNVLRVLWK